MVRDAMTAAIWTGLLIGTMIAFLLGFIALGMLTTPGVDVCHVIKEKTDGICIEQESSETSKRNARPRNNPR
jgi:hypothetical protein